MKIINETGKDFGCITFECAGERLVYILDANDVVVVHNLKVCTPDEYARLNGASGDLQRPADGDVDGN